MPAFTGSPACAGDDSLHTQPTRSKLLSHHIPCPRQFGDDAVDIGLLLFQPLNALVEFRKRDLELGHLPVAEVVEVEHLAHFFEREADLLSGEPAGEPSAIAPRIEALFAARGRLQQTLLFVEAQRARRDSEFLGQVANGEDVAGGRLPGVKANNQVGWTVIRASQFSHAAIPMTCSTYI